MPLTCETFTPEKRDAFQCAIGRAAGVEENPCEAVSIANLECPEPPKEEKVEPECDCCGDGRRRLLWWSRPCLCCKRDGFGLPAYAQNKRKAQRHLLSQLSTGIKVDAEIKVKSAKEAKNSCADLTPSNVNKELSAAGLPHAEVTQECAI